MGWEAETQKPLCQEETICNLYGKYTWDPESLIENLASFIMIFVRIIKPYEVDSVPFPPFIIPWSLASAMLTLRRLLIQRSPMKFLLLHPASFLLRSL